MKLIPSCPTRNLFVRSSTEISSSSHTKTAASLVERMKTMETGIYTENLFFLGVTGNLCTFCLKPPQVSSQVSSQVSGEHGVLVYVEHITSLHHTEICTNSESHYIVNNGHRQPVLLLLLSKEECMQNSICLGQNFSYTLTFIKRSRQHTWYLECNVIRQMVVLTKLSLTA